MGFASWQRYCTALCSGRQPNFAALNRGRHLHSAGRPSLGIGHILVIYFILFIYSFSLASTVTKCGPMPNVMAGAGAYLHAKFHLDTSNSLATIHRRHRQDRQTTADSIRRTVLQTVAQKWHNHCSKFPLIPYEAKRANNLL